MQPSNGLELAPASGQGQLVGEEEPAEVSSAVVAAAAQADGLETGPQAGSGGVGGEAEVQGRCWVVASAAPGGGDGSAWVGPGQPGPPPYPHLCCPRPLWGHEDRDRSEGLETQGWRNRCPWGLGTSWGWDGKASFPAGKRLARKPDI